MVRGRSGLTLSNCSSFDGNHASGFLGRLTNHRPAAVVAAAQRQNTWARSVTGTRGEHRGDRLPPKPGERPGKRGPLRSTERTPAGSRALGSAYRVVRRGGQAARRRGGAASGGAARTPA